MNLPNSKIYSDPKYIQLRREWLAADALYQIVYHDMEGTNCATYQAAQDLRHEAAMNLHNYTLTFTP